MKFRFLFIPLFFSELFSAPLQAEECILKNTRDILDCVLKQHPDVLEAEASLKRDEALKQIAKQRPNPELEGSLVSGKENNATLLDTEVSLLHTMELGGKRKARVNQAKASYQVSMAQVLEFKESALLNTVLALYRLKQLRTEISISEEAIANFQNILAQYQTRPKLSPEQEVSQSAFNLSLDEHRFKRISLIQERDNLQAFLELATGTPFSKLKKFLPSSKKVWPQISDFPKQSVSKNSELKKAEAALDLSEANLNLAKSRAWPDFKIGPKLQTEKRSDTTEIKAGVSLSVPLPFFHFNQGEKSYATLDQSRANINYAMTKKKIMNERFRQVLRYRSAVKAYRSFSLQSLYQKHENIEKLYNRGLVSTSLIIESHHQVHEIIEALHAQELTALDALWRIRIIDGTFNQGGL